MKFTQKKKNKKVIIVSILAACLLVFAAIGIYFFSPLKDRFNTNSNDSSTSQPAGPTSTVDYSGPSKSDTEESQNAKKEAEKQTDSQTPPRGSKKTVPVGISYADIYNDNLEVRAFVSGVIEGTGTCSTTATKNGVTITESSSAFVDASTTQCNPVYIAKSRLSAGIWKIKVSFSSPDAQGLSEIVEVDIQ